MTAANTRTRERVPEPTVVEPSQGALNVCYLCDSLLTEKAAVTAVPDQQCLSLMPDNFRKILILACPSMRGTQVIGLRLTYRVRPLVC